MAMRIGSIAEAAGVEVSTVRYYERRGLLAQPARTGSGYRQYEESAVERIRFVRHAQDLGFTLEEIEELLNLRVDDPSSCEAVEQATRAKLRSVDAKIRELRRLRGVLARLVRACEEKEATEQCPVLAMLEQERSR
jgi:MerR family copper efflux transcriptional regulator